MMPDWNAEAQRAVTHVEAELSEAHRGAFLWYEPQGVVLVFSNGLEESTIPEKQINYQPAGRLYQFFLTRFPRCTTLAGRAAVQRNRRQGEQLRPRRSAPRLTGSVPRF